MYICNCNGITDGQVRDAVQNGAEKWDDVHARYDCTPCCGKCECDISDAIAEYRATGHLNSGLCPRAANRITTFPQMAAGAS